MTVESGVYTILSTSADLAVAAGVSVDQLPALVVRAGAAVDMPERWLALRWVTPVLTGPLGMHSFELRVHDRDRTYDWITGCLEAAKAELTAVVHREGITQIDWRGRSPDLVDDGYGTLTKYDTYVVAAGLATGRK